MKRTILHATLLAASTLFAETPTVSNVAVSPLESGRSLRITYELSEAPAIVTVTLATNGVELASSVFENATGDINRVVTHEMGVIDWHPPRTWIGLSGTITAKVKAYALANPPDYAVFDLREGATAESNRFYDREGDLPGGIGDVRYKTYLLVMRRIPAAGVTWRMGNNVGTQAGDTTLDRSIMHVVTLSKDYYIGVYELTIGQTTNFWAHRVASITGANRAEGPRLPANDMFYEEVRGATKGRLYPALDQSETYAHQVDDDSLIDDLRDRTAITSFDLPTSAQWEFAYRAGCHLNYYWGQDMGRSSVAAESNGVASCAWTTITPGNNSQSHEVGLLTPNGYGLYDMGGNICEWCLDWFTVGATYSDGSDVIDPRGPSETAVRGNPNANPSRVTRGGGYNGDGTGASAITTSSTYVNKSEGASRCSYVGLRVVCGVDLTALAN